jgi:hypothetical protein
MARRATTERPADPGEDRRGFIGLLLGDGRPALFVVGGGLIFAGGFALFLAASRQFLPHDIQFLGMSADDLCEVADRRIVDFMVHDRAAFGGTAFAIGVLDVWLAAFPCGRVSSGRGGRSRCPVASGSSGS